MIQRRDYQDQAVEAVRDAWEKGVSDVLVTAATGTGKTAIFLSLLDEVLIDNPGSRALIIAHRKELIDQPKARLSQYFECAWDAQTGIVMADSDEADRRITVATIQTLATPGRLERILSHGAIDYLILDECHHSTADSYVNVWQQLKNANPGLLHLGVTATPIRGDGDGLAKVYQAEVFHYGIREAIIGRSLVNVRWLAIQTRVSVKDVTTSGGDFVAKRLASVMEVDNVFDLVVESHRQYAADRQAIAFTVSVEGAERLAEKFNSNGISAVAVSANTNKHVRSQAIKDYDAGHIKVLCNVGIYTEGVDLPTASCIHQIRPTKSDSLYVQMMGRALRLWPGKEDALILDYCPKEKRNICMAGDVLGVTIRKDAIVKDSEEEGEVVGGFTFDGKFKYLEGNPADLIARQLDYLDLSPWSWYRAEDNSMSLDLGEGSDHTERVLFVAPAGAENELTLFGIGRKITKLVNADGYETSEKSPYVIKIIASGTFADLQERAEMIANRRGNFGLAQKKRNWRKQPASDKQIKFARHIKGAFKAGASRGEMAQRITHCLARKNLMIAGFINVV